jgi:hypothetical protein
MLCLLLIGRKKEKKKKGETARVFFFPQGWTYLASCAAQDFPGC